MGDHIRAAANWRLAFFFTLVPLLVSIFLASCLGAQPKAVPHIIEVDKLGAARYRGPVGDDVKKYPISEQAIRYHLRTFLVELRSIASDPAIIKANLTEALEWSTPTAQTLVAKPSSTAGSWRSAGAGERGPICGRGRRSTRSWPACAMVSSLSDVQVRLRPTPEDNMEGTKWVKRWKYWIAPKPSRPGVWRMKGGGYLVRGRATDFRTGKQRDILRTVKDTDGAAAYKHLQGALDEVRNGVERPALRRMRFSEYAEALFERKVLKGEIESAQTRENWELMLRLHLFPAFGDVFVDAISRSDVEAWLGDEAKRVREGAYSPVTVNNWLRLFRGIMNEAVDELGLGKNPLLKVKGLDTSAHVTYTEEEPNALTPEEVGPFLATMRDRHPQHLGMVALGFATGWRPSMMRPLRRSGPSADVLWDKNVVLARRSQTRGDEVREATKNSTRFRVTLPRDVMAVLRWHVDRLPAGAMQESDLLFPSETGGYRSATVLDKPFKDVCQHLSLGKKVTPKAMRRTFQDLARRAAVDGLVQRSICGHLTEEMTERYSSVAQAEVEAALGKVVSLAGYRGLLRSAGAGKKRSGGKVVGKTISTPTIAAASPSQPVATT